MCFQYSKHAEKGETRPPDSDTILISLIRSKWYVLLSVLNFQFSLVMPAFTWYLVGFGLDLEIGKTG
ncbi:hypothetical protein HR17_09170 [Porphyromonas gulae]|nr:hypothetical protein HQ49_03740 [Porphyromonas gulae]KGL54318.1 hypothetical protein HQ50_09540 [Porphyromonas sp. COT-052 OH4946]KGN72046.1 hypothetical protein HR17_09170 [Porphyromonas gulae]KGN75992.1 hypothetical protein HQ40_04150 [Porphyromonas gulae]KGO04866.1 hypothetical protein HR16_02805 [Porphyromonas gulae]